MKKRVLSLSLALAMLFTTVTFATEEVATATLSIDAITADLGYVVEPTQYELTEGLTALELVEQVLTESEIAYEITESEWGNYITSINEITEYEFGEQSGWMYLVNGEYASVGMDSYVIENDDLIEVRFTLAWGDDLFDDAETDLEEELEDEELDEEVEEELEPDYIEIDGVTVDANKVAEFNDATNISSWAETSIDIASALGFVNGSNDGNFYPQNSITRAEFAKMIVEVMGLTDDETVVDQMTDVNASDWFANYVKVAQQNGLMNGAYNLFRPTDSITREEIATVLCRAFGIETPEADETVINDIDEASSYAVDYIYAVSSNGIMTGSNNEFSPKDNATREMVAVVLIRSYKTYILEIETEVEEELEDELTDEETTDESEDETEVESDDETTDETEEDTEVELEDSTSEDSQDSTEE